MGDQSVLIDIAHAVKSKDNGVHELDGTVLFSKRLQTRNTKAEKNPLECALEMADLLGHEIVVSYANTKKDYWYGSYLTREEAIRLALSNPNSKYFEIIRPHNARYMIADMEYINGFILGPDDKTMKVNPAVVTETLINFVCDLADELYGIKVERKVEIGSSKGQSSDVNWKHVKKVSKHIKFNFGFHNQRPNRDFADAVTNRILQGNIPYLRYYDSKEKKIKSVFDNHPYSRNQAWRCLNSKKAQDEDPRRRLVADSGSSTNISDHLAVIVDTTDIQILDLDIAGTRHKPRQSSETSAKLGRASGSEQVEKESRSVKSVSLKVPFPLLSSVLQNYADDRASSYGPWKRVLWGAFNVCYENDYLEEGRALVKEFSARSSKYDEREVDVIWNTSQWRQDGLQWPSLRGWLWEDNRPAWRQLRRNPDFSEMMIKDKKNVYRELYIPHPERYKDVIKDVHRYKERYLKPYDMDKHDVHIDCSPMDTKKTARIIELVLSRKYKSVVIYVNRSTLCRAYISRVNTEIRNAMGVYDKTKMFRDYRRPEEVHDPLEDSNGDEDSFESDDNTADPFGGSDSDSENGEIEKTYSIDLERYPFLVVQMESGHRIIGDAPELLVVDECESDLAQFSSSTMKRLKKCSVVFYDYVRTAGKVIFTDAFVSDKTLSFVYNAFLGSTARVIYRHNTWIPENRKAYEITAKDSHGLKSFMMEAIAAKVKARQKVVLFSSNNKFAMAVSEKLRRMFPERVVLLYNKFTDDITKDTHFDNIDTVWITADVVIYSPILLAGVSFNVIDHFNCLFVFGYNMSCCVRDMWQASGRVRKFKDLELFYALDIFGQRPWNLPVTYNSVEASIYRHGDLNRKYIAGTEMDCDMCPGEYVDPTGDLLRAIDDDNFDVENPDNYDIIIQKVQKASIIRKMEKAPAWLMDIHVRNIWEKYLTNNPASYQTVFQDFMQMAGWQRAGILHRSDIIRWENSVRRELGEKPKRVIEEVSNLVRNYEQIKNISSKVAWEITERRNRGMASNVEKHQLEKHWFDTEIVGNQACPSEIKARVFESLDDRIKRKYLMNIWGEANADTYHLAESTTYFNPYPEMMDSTLAILVGMTEMLTLLGLKSTHDTESVICEALLENNLPKLQRIVADLQENLDIRPSTTKSDIPMRVLKLNIDTVLIEFAGTKLFGTPKRFQKGKVRVRNYEYKLKKPEDYFQDIIAVVYEPEMLQSVIAV